MARKGQPMLPLVPADGGTTEDVVRQWLLRHLEKCGPVEIHNDNDDVLDGKLDDTRYL